MNNLRKLSLLARDQLTPFYSKFMEGRSDVLVISYPKTGRTWLRYLIGNVIIQLFELPEEVRSNPRFIIRPWLMKKSNPDIPFIYYSHDDRPHKKDKEKIAVSKSRYYQKPVIFLYRDPRSVAVSQYFSLTRRTELNPFRGSLSEFIRNEKIGPANYIHYLNIWMKEKEYFDQVLFISYEEMKADTSSVLRKVCDFAGLDVTGEVIVNAVKRSDFSEMKKLESESIHDLTLKSKDRKDLNASKMRQGKVDGYKQELGPDDLEYLNRLIAANLDPNYGY